MRTPQAQYERDFTALKHYLIGREYTEALRALGIAVRWHVGYRKDKVTPQLHHQVWVCFNFLNAPVKGLTPRMEERALAALLCHDTVEDCPVTLEDLRQAGLQPLTVDFVKGLTKVENETDEEFFERLLSHWMLPILKACDRDNNVMTMQGAFALPKMKAYIEETRKYILVLLKKASNLFPEHHRAYSALATGIKKQLRIYEGFIKAAEAQDLEHGNLQDQVDQLNAYVNRQADAHAEELKRQEALAASIQAHQAASAANIDKLIKVNQDLRLALAAKSEPALTPLMFSKIAQAAGITSPLAQRDFVQKLHQIVMNTDQPTLLGANVDAEVIKDNSRVLSATLFSDADVVRGLSGTVFRTD